MAHSSVSFSGMTVAGAEISQKCESPGAVPGSRGGSVCHIRAASYPWAPQKFVSIISGTANVPGMAIRTVRLKQDATGTEHPVQDEISNARGREAQFFGGNA
ncbi:hypothetical protein BN77_2778 [Rhizobium mesoamericanum STM3625]|uniref:Uncharacterized protein n=1 Tax=Rhizobium mesoamericanum STM3625 TaxID=1211777 RepID=K0PP29_9HYPH|nr:hypothetical protein BN77_2778 [Rhizobium mesoamericanum STM3625]